MASSEVEFLKKNLTIENALDSIKRFEDNQRLAECENLVKWKNYQHQVVVESSEFFYKVYEELNYFIGPFNSLVRQALAQVYESIGLHWRIVNYVKGDTLIDFEQRQKLEVATSQMASFSEVLISFSHLLDKVEELLEFQSILKQLHEHDAFKDVNGLKLARNCVNKHADYALFSDQFVLLDDADFYIALVNEEGEIVEVQTDVEVEVVTSHGNFLFTSCTSQHATKDGFKRDVPEYNEIVHGWYLFKNREQQHCEREVIKRDFCEDDALALLAKSVEAGANVKKIDSGVNYYGLANKEAKMMSDANAELTEEEILYSNNLGRKTFQWELWQCCNNLCKFCYLGTENRHTDKERQLKSLEDLKKSLAVLGPEYNNVSLIGGEFFQGQLADPDVRESFFEMIEMLADLYVDKKIGSVWITATLTLGDQADLYKTLEIFDRKGVRPLPEYGASGVWICTSWDPQGRFHTKERLENWEFHMKNMEVAYPWIKKNTTIILTQRLCEMYLNGEYDPHSFMDEFGTFLFYKQTGLYQINMDGAGEITSLLEADKLGKIDEFLSKMKLELEKDIGFRFFPDRKTFRKFLVKYAKEDADTFERLFNIKFRADELHRNFNDLYDNQELVRDKDSNFESSGSTDSIVNPNCHLEPYNKKHIILYATYIDCNDCMICDRDQIWESVHGRGN